MTTNESLAAAIRRLNPRFEQLPPERQRELQPDWLASFEELRRQLDEANGDGERDLIAHWESHWRKRLEK